MTHDELLALMAAPIYAARLGVYMAEVAPKTPDSWHLHRNQAMQVSVTEARMIWEIARAVDAAPSG